MAQNSKYPVKLKSDPDFLPLRYTDIFDSNEIQNLQYGMDFREPKYRREVFLRFYEFHLKYRAHPGCVYYLFPYIWSELRLSFEQKLWFCFINGCTQNPCTTYVLFMVFPNLSEIDMSDLEAWHAEYWRRLDYDTDKRYSKGHFVENVKNYLEVLNGRTQEEFFWELTKDKDPMVNFWPVWNKINKDFHLFGRLSTFSYLEYLKIAGLNIDCPELFFYDMSGSKSHRNGICKVLGRDDLDWHKAENPDICFHPFELVEWVEEEAKSLLKEAQERFKGRDFINDVNNFTFESALCTFKGHFRENRRYPNVYNDLLYNRIKKAESFGWEDHSLDFNIFWQARKDCLPQYLRIEDNPKDKGLCKEKQNHFRLTGQMVMLNYEWPEFKNDYNDKYYGN
jgi:hypothetical protein